MNLQIIISYSIDIDIYSPLLKNTLMQILIMHRKIQDINLLSYEYEKIYYSFIFKLLVYF